MGKQSKAHDYKERDHSFDSLRRPFHFDFFACFRSSQLSGDHTNKIEQCHSHVIVVFDPRCDKSYKAYAYLLPQYSLRKYKATKILKQPNLPGFSVFHKHILFTWHFFAVLNVRRGTGRNLHFIWLAKPGDSKSSHRTHKITMKSGNEIAIIPLVQQLQCILRDLKNAYNEIFDFWNLWDSASKFNTFLIYILTSTLHCHENCVTRA